MWKKDVRLQAETMFWSKNIKVQRGLASLQFHVVYIQICAARSSIAATCCSSAVASNYSPKILKFDYQF